jgi:fumarylacetoacetate (FAA) hydrolase family protein
MGHHPSPVGRDGQLRTRRCSLHLESAPACDVLNLENSDHRRSGSTSAFRYQDPDSLREAVRLGKAKDNNASSALGPFIRLFDKGFSLDTLRTEEITLRVTGPDGYRLEGRNSLARISRPFEELVAATIGDHHQYPDGFALYTGTLFAPTADRDEPGRGFTHKTGDVVEIRSTHLGTLINTVAAAEELPPWTFGLAELLRYLTATRAPATRAAQRLDANGEL